jgi:hypothetical protein
MGHYKDTKGQLRDQNCKRNTHKIKTNFNTFYIYSYLNHELSTIWIWAPLWFSTNPEKPSRCIMNDKLTNRMEQSSSR